MDHPNVAPAAGNDGELEMGHAAGVFPPLPAPGGQPVPVQQLGGRAPNSWVGNDINTLLVVAALITTLTYQLGTNIPGGYWQDSQWSKNGTLLHLAGEPIMRDLHRPRYWVFMCASWVGFASSMVMTLSLLVRLAVDSRNVRWSFAVAYSSLVLTFVVSQRRTHLSVDILIWAAVVAFLWITISLHPDRRARVIQGLCCSKAPAAETS
uniref:PGG domain-containing protein n=1 Tax=Arundo donax TaxID=35708 RepID=A0A0A9CF84_ARUDO